MIKDTSLKRNLGEYSWEDARYFLETARIGKINLAAKTLSLTPVTLSRRLAGFEHRLGLVLFLRSRNGVELTDEGRALFEIFERAEAEMNRARDVYAQRSGEIAGVVRLAAPDGLATGLIVPALAQLRDKFPNLSLEIVPLPRRLSLSKREADIAVSVGAPNGERLRTQRLSSYHLGLYAARDYIGRFGAPSVPNDLKEHNLIGFVDDLLYSEDMNYSREIWTGWHSDLAIHSAIAQIEAVRAGLGIGVLHQYLAEPDPALMRLLPETHVTREYWIATHQTMRQLPRIRVVWDFLMGLKDQIFAENLPR